MPYKNPEDKKSHMKKYYAENKERILKKDREYREKNLERIRAKDRERYLTRKDILNKQQRERYADPDYRKKMHVLNKEYREKNKEKLRQYDIGRRDIKNEQARARYAKNTEWRERKNKQVKEAYINPTKGGDSQMIRRLKKRINLIKPIYEKQGYKCNGCERTMPHMLDYEIDHIVPKHEGGKDIESNLQVLCMRCNRMKSINSMEHLQYKLSLLKAHNML